MVAHVSLESQVLAGIIRKRINLMGVRFVPEKALRRQYPLKTGVERPRHSALHTLVTENLTPFFLIPPTSQ
jgi:hypothetical protein